jgi:hypothetical protein
VSSLILGGALMLVLITSSGAGVSPVSFLNGINQGSETRRRDAGATTVAADATHNLQISTLNLP